jgi:hypothetical protein
MKLRPLSGSGSGLIYDNEAYPDYWQDNFEYESMSVRKLDIVRINEAVSFYLEV